MFGRIIDVMALKRILAILVFINFSVGIELSSAEECVAHFEEEFELTRDNSKRDELKLELTEISPDGRTTIKVDNNPGGFWLKSAKPGEYFDGGPFGRVGLELTASDYSKHKAKFKRRWAGECK